MTKEELSTMDNLYRKDNSYAFGWNAPLEIHNGNVYILIWWKGRLMRLDQSPEKLNKKYYDKYAGKTRKEYEWTILKGALLNELKMIDDKFRNSLKKDRKSKTQCATPH